LKFKITKIKKSVLITIEGLVQGVGFRPFVYRLANNYKLKGNVANRTDGVIVNLFGEEKLIESFKNDIVKLTPPAAFVKSIISKNTKSEFKDFKILSSELNDQITEISPDIAVCDDCLEDLKIQSHRINYPFINCTNCGPRFTIINKIPYDRFNTSMSEFEMCETCNKEYNYVLDRRFHAQPVACNHCGPTYLMNDESDFENILDELVTKIDNGKLVTVKGLGGYNIICDAKYDDAVLRTREIKGRDGKPFAVMFRNLEVVQEYCILNPKEEEILKSWQKPIVILEQKLDLANSINYGLNSIGAMLPYMPFHYLMFEKLKTNSIVYTSANNSGNPIISDDNFAINTLKNKLDLFVSHNRKIENPLDDSVVKVVLDDIQIIRRARGFVPKPVYLNRSVEGVFATGAELKSSFCIGKNSSAILSQYIGDLKNLETFNFYEQTASRFCDLFKFQPKIIACDMHPDYFSTQFANKINDNNINGSKIPIVKVQHHHAHIASCLAENQINEKVIGISFDGTGYGTDGNIWGGEFLICDTKSLERFAHFDYVKMPGGDLAVNEPWRMLLSYLKNYNINKIDSLKCFNDVDGKAFEFVNKMLQANINSPLTSSAGRLFDAVACLLNLCTHQTFDAEAPMRLEAIIDKSETDLYPYKYNNGIISFSETINSILNDLNRVETSKISAKFHNTVIQIILDLAKRIENETKINKVVLSGGVFQNKYLIEKTIHILTKNEFEVYTNRLVPPNDGGIALGQLLVASNYL
jgi:hydrogenase maturation protein HypF